MRAVRSAFGRHLCDLAAALPKVWTAHSAWIDDWDDRNPARGQCGSTALVVQDLYGGDLMRGIVVDGFATRHVHYWNVIDGDPVDLTWHQFFGPARIVESAVAARTDLLCRRWFTDRYEALRTHLQLQANAPTS